MVGVLMRGEAVRTECSEPGCEARAYAKGWCRRCWNRAYYRANQSRLQPQARDRMAPAIVRPFTITLGCVACPHKFIAPSTVVGQVVACPKCRRELRVVLEVTRRTCQHCGWAIPAGSDYRAMYCSARCRATAKEARRPPRQKG